MKQELRSRKSTRLRNYDYSQPGYYFVTICTRVRYENILCEIVSVGGAALGAPHVSTLGAPHVSTLGAPHVSTLGAPHISTPSAPHTSNNSPIRIDLTKAGQIVNQYLQGIDKSYKNQVRLDCYTIMPDHIHLIVQLCAPEVGPPLCAPEGGPPRAAAPTIALPNVINALKGLSTKSIGYSIWQRGYYEHIIRNDADLQATRKYIQNNPIKWVLDRTEPNGKEENAE